MIIECKFKCSIELMQKAINTVRNNNTVKRLKPCKLYKLSVDREYRLLSKDKEKWFLVTHQDYNKLIRRSSRSF